MPPNLLISVFNAGIIGGYVTATGDRLQQVRLAVFDPGGPFSAGDRLLRDRLPPKAPLTQQDWGQLKHLISR